MNYIEIGKIVDTHGIKGELRILSDFEYKERIFQKGFHFYIGKEKTEEEVVSYRPHKEYDMVTFKGYDNINQVLKYKKEWVFIKREDLKLQEGEFLQDDLLNLKVVLDGKEVGKVLKIEKVSKTNSIIRVIINGKEVLIPYHKDFIKNIDWKKKEIEFLLIEGM